MSARPSFVIGIAGPSGAGKTAVAEALAQSLGGQCDIVSCDHYYRDLSHLPMAERELVNFDHPDAVEHELLTSHLDLLRTGQSVAMPAYSFETHSRASVREPVAPAPVTIIEGLHVLHWPSVRQLLDVKVFIDVRHEVCLARRVDRDVRERGRTIESCREQYEDTVRPMADAYVFPSRCFADLVLDGTAAVQTSAGEIAGIVRRGE